MKKILAFILALGMSFAICSGFAGADYSDKAYADGNKKDEGTVGTIEGPEQSEDSEYIDTGYLQIAPQIILNPETGCYDIDLYVASSGRYFSNFEAEINFTLVGENNETTRPSAKLTVKQLAKGNLTANMKDGVLSMVFNATKNIDLKNGNILSFEYTDRYLTKIASFKTDLKHNLRIISDHDNEYIEKGFYLNGGKIKTAGVMIEDDGWKHVEEFQDKKVLSGDDLVIVGDYDFDGVLTVKDLIAAQVYLTNKISLENEPILEGMLNSTGLQYLQMYLCESISYFEYFESVIDISGEYGYNKLLHDICGRYWDYEYWENKTFPTDEQGYTYLGEDKYGNYHIWNNDQGVKFFITPKENGKNFGNLYLYEINDNGKIVAPDKTWKFDWGELTCYGVYEYEAINYPGTWDENYWNNQTPNEEDDGLKYSSTYDYFGRYEYKGKDGYGNKHYWLNNGFKFFFKGYIGYRYLINPSDNKIIVISDMEEVEG